MKNGDSRRDFLLKDFALISNYRVVYARGRLAVLGAVLTILGLVVSFGVDAPFPSVMGIYVLLLLVVFSGIRIISALNRGLYVMGSYLRSVETEIDEVGFNTIWGQYIRYNQIDSGSMAFAIAARALNLAVAGIVIFDVWTRHEVIVALGTSLAVINVVLWNEIHIRKRLNPKGFIDRIKRELNEARKACFKLEDVAS